MVVVWMSGWLDDKWLEVKTIGRNEIEEKTRGEPCEGKKPINKNTTQEKRTHHTKDGEEKKESGVNKRIKRK